MNNAQAFHAALKTGDSPNQTVGCRHTNPNICAKNGTPRICAFARVDGICHSPPQSWPKQYTILRKRK